MLANEVGGGLPQAIEAEERQVTVRGIIVHRRAGHGQGVRRWSQIGIEIFQAQHRGVTQAIGEIAQLLNADFRDVR